MQHEAYGGSLLPDGRAMAASAGHDDRPALGFPCFHSGSPTALGLPVGFPTASQFPVGFPGVARPWSLVVPCGLH